MKAIKYKAHRIEPLPCILNILWVIDLSLILFNTSWRIYSTPKEPNYKLVFLSINNETQYVHLLFLWLGYMMYTLSLILGKLFVEKKTINSRVVIEAVSNLGVT